jgi:hypothetical protein
MRSLWIIAVAALGLAACSLYFDHGSKREGQPDAGTADGPQHHPPDAGFPFPDADITDGGCCGFPDAVEPQPDAGEFPLPDAGSGSGCGSGSGSGSPVDAGEAFPDAY